MPKATPSVEDATDLLEDLKTSMPDADDTEEPTELLDKLLSGSNAKAWRPEPGEGIQGTVIDVDSVLSEYRESATGEFPLCPVVVVEDAEGQAWRVVSYSTVLRKEIQKKDPHVGDTVAFLYVGLGEAKKGQKAPHIYRVAVKHND